MLLNFILSLIAKLALPALIKLLHVVLKNLEVKYPGIAPLIEAILKYLDGGGSISTLQEHVNKQCRGLICPTDLGKE